MSNVSFLISSTFPKGRNDCEYGVRRHSKPPAIALIRQDSTQQNLLHHQLIVGLQLAFISTSLHIPLVTSNAYPWRGKFREHVLHITEQLKYELITDAGMKRDLHRARYS